MDSRPWLGNILLKLRNTTAKFQTPAKKRNCSPKNQLITENIASTVVLSLI